MASLLVESEAPGCVKLSREIRVVDGLDRVDIINVLDKKAVREKEGVHLGFAFNVPDGVMRMDIPWAVMRPEIDQIAGACKNWFSVGRWVDVSNRRARRHLGDARCADGGGGRNHRRSRSARMTEPRGLAGQDRAVADALLDGDEQPLVHQLQGRPGGPNHVPLQPAAAQAVRSGGGAAVRHRAQPAAGGRGSPGAAPSGRPLLELPSRDVLVASIKPSEDHKATIVRLFGAAGRPAKVTLRWGEKPPQRVWISNLAEEKVGAATGAVDVPAYGLITLRAE